MQPTSSRRFTKHALAGLAVAGLMFTAGCSAIQNFAGNLFGEENTSLAWASEPAGEPIWTVETQSVGSGPHIVGDTVVSYVWESGRLGLAGYDLETGEQKWFEPGTTGSLNPHYALELRLFTATDGTPLVLNVQGQSSHPDGLGQSWLTHKRSVIEVETGEVRARNDGDIFQGPARNCVRTDIACSTGYKNGGNLTVFGVDENAELVETPDIAALPEHETVHNSISTGLASGLANDGTAIATYVEDSEPKWSFPLSEMGIEGLTQHENPGYFDDFSFGSQLFPEEGVIIASGGKRLPDAGSTEFHTAGYDVETGKRLWAHDKYMCWDDVMCDGELRYEKDENRVYHYPAQDLTLSGFDPATGEETWSVDVAGLKPFETDNWSFAGSEAYVLNTADSRTILNTKNGEITDITEEQTFACQSDGAPFSQPADGIHDRPVKEYVKNYVQQACGLWGESGDLSKFSKAAVADGSTNPFGTKFSEWNIFDEQVRVIATEEGFAAYRF